MKRSLAFVLGGGGSRGALQVGALRALLERDIHPDLLVGSSAGAINAAFMGLDPSLEQIRLLENAWRQAAQKDFFPSGWMPVIGRALRNRVGFPQGTLLREFFLTHLPAPDLTFRQMRIPVYLVATDLNHAKMIVFGTRPDQFVLEGILASAALPPWVHPLENGDQFLMDGGAVSNLPIETAISQGASEVVALDLSDPADLPVTSHGFGPFAAKLMNTVVRRQLELEMKLADTCGITVHRVELRSDPPVTFTDFSHPEELFEQGYAIANQTLDETWRPKPVVMIERPYAG